MRMDQELAKRLLIEGGTFVFLGVPEETQFGIDMHCWNTAEDFRGVKMIPEGLHYIHYSAVSQSTGDVSPRSGFMHYFKKKEFMVKLWDKKMEDISKDQISDESIQRLKDNLFNIDRFLAPYPFENWHKWKILTSHITAELAERLSPETGIIRSSVELLSMSNEERPKGVKSSNTLENINDSTSSTEEQTTSEQHTTKRQKVRISSENKEDSMLPDLKPAPGTAIRFTEVPKEKYPKGSTPQEITKHHLDQTYTLETMMAQHNEPLDIIGELQFAYLCFLIGQSLDALEHWKNLVIILCSCDEAIKKYNDVYFHFIKTIPVQVLEMPEEFLADIVMNKNLVYKKLKEFFRTAQADKVSGRLFSMIGELKQKLTDKFQWDFTELDSEDEDEKPVIVKL